MFFSRDGKQIIHQLHDARCSLILRVQLNRVDELWAQHPAWTILGPPQDLLEWLQDLRTMPGVKLEKVAPDIEESIARLIDSHARIGPLYVKRMRLSKYQQRIESDRTILAQSVEVSGSTLCETEVKRRNRTQSVCHAFADGASPS